MELTVYGIETKPCLLLMLLVQIMLQQYLPFTVLKRFEKFFVCFKFNFKLQQHLPFTVLKPSLPSMIAATNWWVATALTVYGIDTQMDWNSDDWKFLSCNSTYRLRYWNPFLVPTRTAVMISCNSTYRLRYAPKGARQQRSKATMRSAHLKCLNEVKVKQN